MHDTNNKHRLISASKLGPRAQQTYRAELVNVIRELVLVELGHLLAQGVDGLGTQLVHLLELILFPHYGGAC